MMYVQEDAIMIEMANGKVDVAGLTWEGIQKSYCDKRDYRKLLIAVWVLGLLFITQPVAWSMHFQRSAAPRSTEIPAGLTQAEKDYLPPAPRCK